MNALPVESIYVSNKNIQTATDGSTVASPNECIFGETALSFTIPDGYQRYAFICYNAGSSTESWTIDFVSAPTQSIKVYSQNLWNHQTTGSYIATQTPTGFSVQFIWDTSPVGPEQPIVFVIELKYLELI